MDYPDLRAELLATFKVEAEEHLATLDSGLLELERPGSEREALVHELFRAAHSLKGAARMVDLGEVERLAHAMEDLLGRLRDGSMEPGSRLVDLLLAATDGLRAALAAGEGGTGEALTDELVAALQAAAAGATFEVPRRPEAVEAGVTAPAEEAQGAGVPAAPPPAPAAAPALGAPGEHLRVAAAAVDRLVEIVAELGVGVQWVRQPLRLVRGEERALRGLAAEVAGLRSRLGGDAAAAQDLERLEEALRDRASALAAAAHAGRGRAEELLRLAREAGEAAQGLRMLPLDTVFGRLPRVVRDAARQSGKLVELTTSGGETALDRAVLERLADPLLHLVRNAVDHGLEGPRERRAAGKPEAGRLRVTARQRGGLVEVEVADDGRGIDVDRVVERAVEAGILDGERAAAMTPGERLQLVFASGLSTAERVTAISGRGVGLDVVRENLERLQGRVTVASEPGRGTVFTLSVPLSLAATFALLVRCGGTVLAFPGTTVERVLRVQRSELGAVDGHPVLELGGRPLPVVDLGAVTGLGTAAPENGRLRLVVAGVAERRLGLVVEGLEGTQELVVTDLGPQLRGLAQAAGGAILPDGRVAVVVDVAAVMDEATRRGEAPAAVVREERARRRRVLLADDSLTTRALEKTILEGAGYEVLACADGEAAWQVLRSETVDAVVTDIQMPRMDGFDLTARIRSDSRLRELPVVLVTSLESAQDRARGLEVGADAYIVKRTFDQRELLETLERFLGGER